MTKYLFSMLLACFATTNVVGQIRLNLDTAIPITSAEIYTSLEPGWVMMPTAETISHDVSFVYETPQQFPVGESITVRFNSDNSLVYEFTPSLEWSGVQTYAANFEFELTRTGILLRYRERLWSNGNVQTRILLTEIYEDVEAQHVTSPIQSETGFVIPATLEPMQVARAAIYEIWLREIARSWVFAYVGFALGLLWLVRKSSNRIGRGQA